MTQGMLIQNIQMRDGGGACRIRLNDGIADRTTMRKTAGPPRATLNVFSRIRTYRLNYPLTGGNLTQDMQYPWGEGLDILKSSSCSQMPRWGSERMGYNDDQRQPVVLGIAGSCGNPEVRQSERRARGGSARAAALQGRGVRS